MMGYLACPVDLYHTARYQTGRALARARWPGVAWIEPARMGWDLETWWSEWAHILPALNLLAVIPRADGTIGRGVWQEITGCQRRGVPVYVLDGRRWRNNFCVELTGGESFRYWAKVRAHHE